MGAGGKVPVDTAAMTTSKRLMGWYCLSGMSTHCKLLEGRYCPWLAAAGVGADQLPYHKQQQRQQQQGLQVHCNKQQPLLVTVIAAQAACWLLGKLGGFGAARRARGSLGGWVRD